jgi:hypothetical protein
VGLDGFIIYLIDGAVQASHSSGIPLLQLRHTVHVIRAGCRSFMCLSVVAVWDMIFRTCA